MRLDRKVAADSAGRIAEIGGGGSDRRNAGQDDARRRAGRLGSAFRNLLGIDEDEAEPNDPTPIPEHDPARATFDRVGSFLFNHRLDPSPANYDLAYQYTTGVNRRLVAAIDEILTREELSDELAETVLEDCRRDISANSLAKLVDEAQAGLTSTAGVVRQTGADVEAYGQALETGAGAFDSSQSGEIAVAQLLQLTRAMIEKTRESEQQLRVTGKRIAALRSSLNEARRVATSDALTGLPNRRAFESKLRVAVSEARAAGRPLSLAFCDIDHFKSINDTHGHEVGDRILKFVARLLSGVSDNSCHVARHGGEEFVMLFENRTLNEAWEAVDACRVDLEGRRLVAKQSGDPIGQVTFSAGIASLGVGDGGRELLRKADMALYKAKHEGRNRVILAERG